MITERTYKLQLENTNFNLEQMLAKLPLEKDAQAFKQRILGVMQLYFDGLVDNEFPEGELDQEKANLWQEQKKTLDDLSTGVQMTVAGFYLRDKVPYDAVLDLVLPHKENLLKFGSDKNGKVRHLTGCESAIYDTFNKSLPNLVREQFDVLVPVASGGFEAAALLSEMLGIPQVPIRYSRTARKDTFVRFPKYAPQSYLSAQVLGKNVLIVEDVVVDGRTLKEVESCLALFNPKKLLTYLSLNH